MKNIKKIMVVDDSPFICNILVSYLESNENLKVTGVAMDGLQALNLLKNTDPDVITLDLELPGCNGLKVLESIMNERPTPVVVISGVSRNSADTVMNALKLGAVDFILKYNHNDRTDPEILRKIIIKKVCLASEIKVVRSLKQSSINGDVDIENIKYTFGNEIEKGQVSKEAISDSVVVIGASTGGPSAVCEIISSLPHNFQSSIIIVQHIIDSYTEVFAQYLKRFTEYNVEVAKSGSKLTRGHILIAPGDSHLLIDKDRSVVISNDDKHKGHRPSIDITMKSVSKVFGSSTKGVLLTGMGDDGAEGLSYIKSLGGTTYVQEPSTCVVNSMPMSAIKKGVADVVTRTREIGQILGDSSSEIISEVQVNKTIRGYLN